MWGLRGNAKEARWSEGNALKGEKRRCGSTAGGSGQVNGLRFEELIDDREQAKRVEMKARGRLMLEARQRLDGGAVRPVRRTRGNTRTSRRTG